MLEDMPQSSKGLNIMATRCGGRDAVENTVPAAVKAIQNGCDMI
jgi:glycerophosphoryl diester phosphodiesterase